MNIVKLLEATDAFNKYLSETDIEQAKAQYPDLRDRATQIKVIEDAKQGNLDAVNLLYFLFKGLTAKAFWSYYLGPDKKYWPSRLRAGEDYDFASKAYELLASGDTGKTSPYATFNPDKFSAKTDLIKKFGYYFFRYLQNEAFKMLRKKGMQGISGNIPKDANLSVESYEDVHDNTNETAVASGTEDIDLKLTLDSFVDTLPFKYKKVFNLKRQGMSMEDIGAELGIHQNSVRTYMKDIKDKWDEYV